MIANNISNGFKQLISLLSAFIDTLFDKNLASLQLIKNHNLSINDRNDQKDTLSHVKNSSRLLLL